MLAGIPRRQDTVGGQHAGGLSPSRRRGVTAPLILCVDDHAAMLHALTRLFGLEGWRVQTATTARSAMTQARTTAFDAWVIDLKLPDKSGLELLRGLRGSGLMTPAVFLTGFPTDNSATAAAELGAGYLVKGKVRGPAIVAAVRALLVHPATPKAKADPVRPAIVELIRALAAEQESAGTVRQAACRSFASLLSDPELAFTSFVCAAAALCALLDAGIADERLVKLLPAQLAKLSDRQGVSVEFLDLLEERADAIGTRWSAIGKRDMALLAGSNEATLEGLLDRLGLSWPQFRRAVVMRRAVGLLAYDDDFVAQVAYRLGYEYATAFDRDFRAFLGIAPSMFRRMARSES